MEIRPIRTEEDHRSALARIDALLESEPGTPEADLLEVISTLVAAYEDKHHPIPPPDPIDALVYYMESRGLTERDLRPYLGTRGRVWEVLNRRRALSITMIRNLNQQLGIPAEVLLRPYPLVRPEQEVGSAGPR
jgi:HTH-type transcriptional regulator/antitoxin HigA